ncbi:MAG: single-stranded DNA-binding protein [Thermoanaerobaculia bacterium]|nr:single-stranded DNA-binding protein [Thermoanaerobaculia bacterium]
MTGSGTARELLSIYRRLADAVDELEFESPVTHVYNPLRYAWEGHRKYLERFGSGKGRIILLGMNPGPWGMAQTGVPFGDVTHVREWLGIEAEIGSPEDEHPKRTVEGFDCSRSEVSGTRLWGWARTRFGTPEAFFDRFLVLNYCPLSFLEESGRNRTPPRLPKAEREPLFRVCDEAVEEATDALAPELVVGIGRFAERRARAVLGDDPHEVACILHPSPASPAANRGWAERAEEQLREAGVEL